MKRSHALLSVSLLVVMMMFTVQCSSPLVLCSRFYTAVDAKRGDCTIVVSGNQSSCEENIEQCSDSDREVINETLDCIDKLDVCAKPESVKFGLAVASCGTQLKKISVDCAKAFAF